MRRGRLLAAGLLALGAGVMGSGCQLGALVGGMAASAQRKGVTEVSAQYRGLEGTTFAVIVAADRVIEADHPTVVPDLTVTVTKRLEENAGAAGRVPHQGVLAYQATNPSWSLMSPEEIGREFGVDRVVYIELIEYRLHEPGNEYLWNGVAAGRVRVYEMDASIAEYAAFERSIQASFPDGTGFGPAQVPQRTVEVALASRFVDLTTELFYDHERPNSRRY